MKTNLRKKLEGFTIIEVLIVLAIAGLIMMIVFLAVPALQRNSRNTQRRNDVSSYLGAVAEWSNNNNGAIPTTDANLTTANSGVNALAKMNLLTAPTIVITGAQATPVGVDTMQYVARATCDTGTIGNTLAGSNRQYAIRFAVENATGAATPQCQGS